MYVRTCLQQLGSESLEEIRRVLSTAGGADDIGSLLSVITERLDVLMAPRTGHGAGIELPHVYSWRGALRTITQAIVEPDDLKWMDDDESASDALFANRAIIDIETRFERCVPQLSSEEH